MKTFLKNIPFGQITIPLFFIHLLGIVLFFLIQTNLPPVAPLLYGLPYGEDQLVPKMFLIAPFVIGLVFLFVNSLIIKFTKDSFSQKALLYLIIATSLLGLVSVVKVVFLVGEF